MVSVWEESGYRPLKPRAVAMEDDDERAGQEEVHHQHSYQSRRLNALPDFQVSIPIHIFYAEREGLTVSVS